MQTFGTFNTTPPTLQDGQDSSLQLDANGNLKVTSSDTPPVTAPDGAAAVSERGNYGASNTAPDDAGTLTVGRSLAIVATVAGNVKVRFTDGTDFTFPVAVGLTIVPFEINRIYATDTTATATYAILK